MVIDLDAMEAEIRKRHGIKISKDDPIMIMVTMIALLEQELLQEKKNQLSDFVSVMEAFMTRYNQNASAISNQMLSQTASQVQSIINKTLSESKEALQHAIEQSIQTKTASIKKQLEPSIRRVEKTASTSLVVACVTALAAALALWASL